MAYRVRHTLPPDRVTRFPNSRCFSLQANCRILRLWSTPPHKVSRRRRRHLSLWWWAKRPPRPSERHDVLRGSDGRLCALRRDRLWCESPSLLACPLSLNIHSSDDKMLMVWDLRPNVDIPSAPLSRSPSDAHADSDGASSARPQPTAYVISFPHALSAVCAHASTTKDLLVADVRGSLALIDWRSDPSHAPPTDAWHHPHVVEFSAPRAIAGGAGAFPASAAWHHANPDMYAPPLPSHTNETANNLLCPLLTFGKKKKTA